MLKCYNEFTRAVEKAKQAREQLNVLILGLEDNPKIKRINANCYLINSGDLEQGNILSATHYDFKYQYKVIVQYLEAVNIDVYLLRLAEILFFKKVVITEGVRQRITLHGKVVKNIVDAIGKDIKVLIDEVEKREKQKREEKKRKRDSGGRNYAIDLR